MSKMKKIEDMTECEINECMGFVMDSKMQESYAGNKEKDWLFAFLMDPHLMNRLYEHSQRLREITENKEKLSSKLHMQADSAGVVKL